MEKEVEIVQDKNTQLYWLIIRAAEKSEGYLLTKKELNKLRAEIENKLSE